MVANRLEMGFLSELDGGGGGRLECFLERRRSSLMMDGAFSMSVLSGCARSTSAGFARDLNKYRESFDTGMTSPIGSI